MMDLRLTVSDLILAQGLKFWTSVVEDRQIEQLDQCFQIITALGEFLRTVNIEKEDGEKLKNVKSFQISVNKTDDRVTTNERQDENPSSKQENEEIKEMEDVAHNVDNENKENETDSQDDDLDDLFNIIECSDDLLDEDLSEEVIAEQENRNCLESKEETMKTESEESDNKADLTGGKKAKKKNNKYPWFGKKSCEYCGDILPSLYLLSVHISRDHKEFYEEFENRHKTMKCDQCSYTCYTDRQMYHHLKTFHPHNCHQCGKIFHRENALKIHMEEHDEKGKSFNCEKCSKVFQNRSRLRKHSLRHLKTEHKCTICEKILKSSDGLRGHIKRYHGKPQPKLQQLIKCRFCELVFDTRYKRAKHEFKHHNQKRKEPFLCILCGYKTFNITRHMDTHSDKNIPCDICGKVFISQKYRIRHHETVHLPDSEKPFKCSQEGCERAFRHQPSLESHVNSHLGIKPYQCDFCDTRFQNSSNKAAHLRKVHRFSKK